MKFSVEAVARAERQAAERKALADRLRHGHFDTDMPETITDKVFAKAWEDGHASGEHEVEQVYAELAEIVSAAFSAGVDFGYC